MKAIILFVMILIGCGAERATVSAEPEALTFEKEEENQIMYRCLILVQIADNWRRGFNTHYLPVYLPCKKLGLDDGMLSLDCSEPFDALRLDRRINNDWQYIHTGSCELAQGLHYNPPIVNEILYGEEN